MLSNPGTLDQIAPLDTGLEPLYQAVVAGSHTTVLQNLPAHIRAIILKAAKLSDVVQQHQSILLEHLQRLVHTKFRTKLLENQDIPDRL